MAFDLDVARTFESGVAVVADDRKDAAVAVAAVAEEFRAGVDVAGE